MSDSWRNLELGGQEFKVSSGSIIMLPAHRPATRSWAGASEVGIQLWTVRDAVCPKWGWGVRRLGGVFAGVIMTESRDISCVDKETGIEIFEGERLGRNKGLQHGGVGGGIVWPVKFSDVLSGGSGEDRGIPGKDNTHLQAQGHSSIRFSLWRGRETRRWQDLNPGRGIRVPQVRAQTGRLPGAARVCWRSWVDSRPWSQSLLGLKPRSVTYCR